MALADIIERIAADADAEAAVLIADAQARADAVSEKAQAAADAYAEEAHVAARRDATRTADTIRVNARLAARDRAVAARRALIDEALAAAAERLAGLDDATYATFLGRKVAEAARGDETLHVGSADAARVDAIVDAARTAEPGLELSVSAEPAPFERGALLVGDRVRAELSLDAIVAERRDDLELAVVRALAGGEG